MLNVGYITLHNVVNFHMINHFFSTALWPLCYVYYPGIFFSLFFLGGGGRLRRYLHVFPPVIPNLEAWIGGWGEMKITW